MREHEVMAWHELPSVLSLLCSTQLCLLFHKPRQKVLPASEYSNWNPD